MTFSYVTAEYRCTQCTGVRSEHASTFSVPYVVAALIAAIPWGFVLSRAPWNFPWYYFFCIFAGELLVLFVAGLPLSFFFIGGSMARRCSICGAPMTLRGRYFTKLQKPRWADAALLLLFFAMNVAAWLVWYHHA